jgi:hypothetical protein
VSLWLTSGRGRYLTRVSRLRRYTSNPRFSDFKDLLDLFAARKHVRLTRAKTCRDVLDRFRREHHALDRARRVERVLIHEAFDMELPEHDALSRRIEAEDSDVLDNVAPHGQISNGQWK